MLEHGGLTQRVIGAAIEVHRALGAGFLESIYENALAHELRKRGVLTEQQVPVAVHYDGVVVGEHRLDFLVERTIIIELKAVKDVEDIHFAIVRSYLNAMQLTHGLLLNFRAMPLLIKRVHA